LNSGFTGFPAGSFSSENAPELFHALKWLRISPVDILDLADQMIRPVPLPAVDRHDEIL